jgi:hypothetical protein
MKDWDPIFNRELKISSKKFRVLFALNAALSLALTGGIIFVAVHFIRKFW